MKVKPGRCNPSSWGPYGGQRSGIQAFIQMNSSGSLPVQSHESLTVLLPQGSATYVCLRTSENSLITAAKVEFMQSSRMTDDGSRSFYESSHQ